MGISPLGDDEKSHFHVEVVSVIGTISIQSAILWESITSLDLQEESPANHLDLPRGPRQDNKDLQDAQDPGLLQDVQDLQHPCPLHGIGTYLEKCLHQLAETAQYLLDGTVLYLKDTLILCIITSLQDPKKIV